MRNLQAIPGAGVVAENNPGVNKLVKDISQYTISATQQLGRALPGAPGYVPPKERPIVALENLHEQIVDSTGNPKSATGSASKVWDSNPNPTLVDPRLMQSVPLPNNSLSKAMETVMSLKGPDTPLSKKEEQQAYKIVRDMVVAQKLTPDQAAKDIVEYMKLGVLKSKDFYKYDQFGIPVPKSYYSEWEATGMFGRTIPVNLINEGSVKQALVKDIRGFAAFDAATGGPFQLVR